MRIFSTAKRLASIIWKDGGLSWLWAVLSALPGAIQSLAKYLPGETQKALAMLDHPVQWWWGLPVVGVWIVFSLTRRILAYETPAVELEIYRDERSRNTWWLEVRNTGTKIINNCVVDFERIEDISGKRIFPQSFGLARSGDHSNPFPLRPKQPKQGRFSDLKPDGRIVIFGTRADREPVEIVLEDEKYFVTVGAYTELEGASCRKRITLLRGYGELRCEFND